MWPYVLLAYFLSPLIVDLLLSPWQLEGFSGETDHNMPQARLP